MLHPFVNTNWGVPAGLAAYDSLGAYRLITDMGGYGTRVRISTHNGKRYVIISGRRGTYRRLRGTRYLETNPRIVEAGIGRYGQTEPPRVSRRLHLLRNWSHYAKAA